jgi:CrcB protein
MAGGAMGTVARYGISLFTIKYFESGFPWATLAANLIGAFLIGLFWGIWEGSSLSPNLRLFIMVGVLGGFTTFSTFTLETLNLFRGGEVKMALTYILASNVLGLLFVYFGFLLAMNLEK